LRIRGSYFAFKEWNPFLLIKPTIEKEYLKIYVLKSLILLHLFSDKNTTIRK
jgi:hypothetical protein